MLVTFNSGYSTSVNEIRRRFHQQISNEIFLKPVSSSSNLQFQVIWLVEIRVEDGLEENIKLIFFMKPGPGHDLRYLDLVLQFFEHGQIPVALIT